VSVESLITSLVQQAPDIDLALIGELRAELERDGRALALAISRVIELVGEQLVDPAIALPALAEACATLAAFTDPRVLEAARYQVDTLLPVPDAPPVRPPDVPVGALRRR
jgi:hypothetical protein